MSRPNDIYIKRGSRVLGPFSTEQQRRLYGLGKITDDDLASPSKIGPWIQFRQLNGDDQEEAEATVSPPPVKRSPPNPPPVKRRKPKAPRVPSVDLDEIVEQTQRTRSQPKSGNHDCFQCGHSYAGFISACPQCGTRRPKRRRKKAETTTTDAEESRGRWQFVRGSLLPVYYSTLTLCLVGMAACSQMVVLWYLILFEISRLVWVFAFVLGFAVLMLVWQWAFVMHEEYIYEVIGYTGFALFFWMCLHFYPQSAGPIVAASLVVSFVASIGILVGFFGCCAVPREAAALRWLILSVLCVASAVAAWGMILITLAVNFAQLAAGNVNPPGFDLITVVKWMVATAAFSLLAQIFYCWFLRNIATHFKEEKVAEGIDHYTRQQIYGFGAIVVICFGFIGWFLGIPNGAAEAVVGLACFCTCMAVFATVTFGKLCSFVGATSGCIRC